MGILVRVIVYCHKDWGRSHNAITACPCGAKSIFEYLSSAHQRALFFDSESIWEPRLIHCFP